MLGNLSFCKSFIVLAIWLMKYDSINQCFVKSSLKSRILTLVQSMECLLSKGSGYFASRGKIAPCYFAIWRQNSPNGYFASSAYIALSLMLTQTLTPTQTLTLILTLIPTLSLTQTLTQTEEKHYFASRGKIASSLSKTCLVSADLANSRCRMSAKCSFLQMEKLFCSANI